jgi:hypothetical protein
VLLWSTCFPINAGLMCIIRCDCCHNCQLHVMDKGLHCAAGWDLRPELGPKQPQLPRARGEVFTQDVLTTLQCVCPCGKVCAAWTTVNNQHHPPN